MLLLCVGRGGGLRIWSLRLKRGEERKGTELEILKLGISVNT